MKKVFLFLAVVFSLASYADAGHGYRFSVKTILKNTDTINGYIYVYSWEKYKGFGNLNQFLYENVPNHKLNIYSHIVTATNDLTTLDFAVSNSKLTINLKDIIKINEIDILSFGGGIFRLKELSEAEFKLIKIGNPYSKSINAYDLTEYCHLLFLDWNKPINSELANELHKKLELKKIELGDNLEGEKGSLFYSYFNQLKEELTYKGILLIMYCESC